MTTKAITYWKADKPTSAKINDIMERMAEKHHAAQELAREYGAEGVYWTSGFTTKHCSGFVFKSTPDEKLFCRMQRTPNGWKPRLRGPGKEIEKKLDALSDSGGGDIAKLIGMNCFTGLSCRTPGVVMVKGTAYISVPEDVTPKHCTRITDVAFEKVTGAKKKKAKSP